MTHDDGLEALLAEHGFANGSRERYCYCGFFLGDWAGELQMADHVAAVVRAAGWVRGREECSEREPHPFG